MSLSGIAKFAESLTGEVVLPHDRKYAHLRRVKNRAIDKHPALIVRCANQKDVRLAVEFARGKGLLTAVRSGSHSFAGHGVCDKGIVIDLLTLKRVQIHPVHQKILIEPGVVAGDLDCLTQSFRMAAPLGSCRSCPTVGVAGYAPCGGESSLIPKR
jgi:FAD/FMN-containing dehydrogenase